jgi:hypothetical protein
MTTLRFASLSFALVASGLFVMNGAACSSSSPNESSDSGTDTGKGSDAPATSDTMASGDVVVPPFDGPDPDTWNNFAKGFFATYCVECHNATIPDPTDDPNQNFNIYSDVVGLKTTIRCGVSPGIASMTGVTTNDYQPGCPKTGFPPPGQFPIYNAAMSNPKPSSAERLRLIAWIDHGAPEN